MLIQEMNAATLKGILSYNFCSYKPLHGNDFEVYRPEKERVSYTRLPKMLRGGYDFAMEMLTVKILRN